MAIPAPQIMLYVSIIANPFKTSHRPNVTSFTAYVAPQSALHSMLGNRSNRMEHRSKPEPRRKEYKQTIVSYSCTCVLHEAPFKFFFPFETRSPPHVPSRTFLLDVPFTRVLPLLRHFQQVAEWSAFRSRVALPDLPLGQLGEGTRHVCTHQYLTIYRNGSLNINFSRLLPDDSRSQRQPSTTLGNALICPKPSASLIEPPRLLVCYVGQLAML
jgi:hypothetical protein